MKSEKSPIIWDFLNLKTSSPHLKDRQVYEKIETGEASFALRKGLSKDMTQKGESIQTGQTKMWILPTISHQNDLKPNHKGGIFKG